MQKGAGEVTDILIYGDIGFEVTPAAITEQLKAAEGDVTVHINSPGGDVYDGLAIMNALRAHDGHITAIVEGMAASAASFIAVGGADTLICRPTGELMIHDAWTFADGNAEALTKTVANLERMSEKLAAIYAEKAGGEPSAWRERMRAETWFSADEALEAGLVDAVEDSRAKQPVEALGRSKILARFKYEGRRAAPDPMLGRQKGDSMSAFDKLLAKFGEEKMVAALEHVLNEEVTVNVTVELSYEPAEIVPTDKVVLQPVGDIPPGLVFAAGEVPEGWGVEVAEDTGVVTVTAPAGAEPGDEVTIPVLVTGDGVEVELSAQVTVKAAAPEESESEGESPAKSAPAGPETVTLDMDTYNWLKDAAARGAEAKAKADEADIRAEVDGWVKEGRLHPQNREKAFEDLKARGDAARVLYSSIPENTFPVREIGHSRDDEVNENKISGAANPFASVRY